MELMNFKGLDAFTISKTQQRRVLVRTTLAVCCILRKHLPRDTEEFKSLLGRRMLESSYKDHGKGPTQVTTSFYIYFSFPLGMAIQRIGCVNAHSLG